MELKNQVCSLELSKKLKELGFEQESLFYYNSYFNGTFIEMDNKYKDDISGVSAYTVAELGEMLPVTIKINGTIIMLKCSKRDIGWSIRYVQAKREGLTEISELADTEADARSKMLIYLKENNLI